jgi:hypothetical protein
MIENPIIDEIHRIREQMLARYNGDLDALLLDAQRRTEEAARAGKRVVACPSRSDSPVKPAKKKAG